MTEIFALMQRLSLLCLDSAAMFQNEGKEIPLTYQTVNYLFVTLGYSWTKDVKQDEGALQDKEGSVAQRIFWGIGQSLYKAQVYNFLLQ